MVAAVLTGCGQLSHSNAITAAAVDADGTPFAQGHVHTLKITLTNSSKWVVVLTELEPLTNEDETGYAFQRPALGAVTVTPKAGFAYSSSAQQQTEAIFNEGLLMPGQSVTVVKAHRVLEPVEKFRLHYTLLDTPRGLSELTGKIFLPAGDGTYPFCTTEALERYGGIPTSSVTESSTPSARAVVFPSGKHGKSRGDTTLLFRHDDLEISFGTLKPVAMGRTEAGEKAGVSAYNAYAYSEALASWIVRRGGDRVVVPVDGSEPWTIADVDSRFFRDVDQTGAAVLSGEDASAFTALGFEADKDGVKVTRQKLKDFLKHPALTDALGRRIRVTAQYSLFDAHTFKIERP